MKNFPVENELWIEKIAKVTHLENLGKRIHEGLGPYLSLWVVWCLHSFVVTPLTLGPEYSFLRVFASDVLLALLGLSFGVWALKKMRNKYQETTSYLDLSWRSVSSKLKFFVFFSGWAIFLSYFLVNAGILLNPMTGEFVIPPKYGSVFHSLYYAIMILVYVPIISEFMTYFIDIHFLFPLKVRKTKPKLNFSDLERFGGMKKLGSLSLLSSEFYFVGLALFSLIPVLYPNIVGPGTAFLLIGAWITGIILFFLPALIIRSYVSSEKRKELRRLERKIREAGEEPGGRLEVSPKSPEENIEYLFLYLEHEHLYNISEFPFDAGILQQLFISSLIPIIAQLIIFTLS